VAVSGSHLALQNAVMSPSGTVAFSWDSFNAVCNRRLCQDSNVVLHVSTLAPGATTWVDSGPLLGPDAGQHFGQLAADGLGDIGLLSLSGGNVVSLVNHGGANWGSPVIVASNSVIGFYPGAGYDNRSYKADLAGHAIFAGFGSSNLLAVDGNLTNNTWGTPTNISGSDQSPGYFDLAMSSLGSAIVVWEDTAPGNGSTYLWRAATRKGPTAAWDAPHTAGQGFAFVGPPDGVAINDAGQAVITFGGYTSDYLTRILYSNVYQP